MNPTTTELRDLLVTLLAGVAGRTREHWAAALGEVERLEPLWKYVRGNWRVHPRGSNDDLRAIAAAVDVVKREHPYVSG